ncbi:MAG: hypothetical protein ACRCXZ_07390 [Patescibacteria group bacterium]
MEKINLDDLENGLWFIFVGNKQHLKNIIENCENQSNVLFTDDLTIKEYSDKYIDELGLCIVNKDLDVKILDVVNFPDPEFDWCSVLQQFENNYTEYEPVNGKYKWGQIAPRDCEIMCDNCGYITSIKEGETFPICEACQSGLPNSPTSPDEAFWIIL